MSKQGGGDDGDGILSGADISRQAIPQLKVQAEDFASHVQISFPRSSVQPNKLKLASDRCNVLIEDLQRIRNTLVLLDKVAVVYVVEELLKLLDAYTDSLISDHSALSRVLSRAAGELSAHIERLCVDSSIDSALSLLPLVNDCRACRGESLLSDTLLMAAGIQMLQTNPVANNEASWIKQRQQWQLHAASRHGSLAKRLLDWWRTDVANADGQLASEFDMLCNFCKARDQLEIMVPLFQAAGLLARGLSDSQVADGPATRSLFAQLERHLHRCKEVELPEDLLPADLLRNFLYYVAQMETSDAAAIQLQRQYRLDRVRQVSKINESQATPTIGVGYHLMSAIRSGVRTETTQIREWLEQADKRERPRLIRLKVRLSQLEPVLTLVGALQALRCLESINADLASLEQEPSRSTAVHKRLAESLLLLDTLLDQSARHSVNRHLNNPDMPPAQKVQDVFVDMATDACFRESRATLQQVHASLGTLFLTRPLSASKCKAIVQRLRRVDHVLQILPLPEITPLLQGLSGALTELQRDSNAHQPISSTALTNIQSAMISILDCVDRYLASALRTDASTSQLLSEGEDALILLNQRLSSTQNSEVTANAQSKVPTNTPVERSSKFAKDAVVRQRCVAKLLAIMERLSQSIAAYDQQPGGDTLRNIALDLQDFEKEACQGGTPSLQTLARSARKWFVHCSATGDTISDEQRRVIEEVHAVIPQLIDQWLGGTSRVRGLEELLATLKAPSGPIGSDVSQGSQVDEPDFGQTLRTVFRSECSNQLDVLQEAVTSALQPSTNLSQQLPTENLLRVLHRLTGSAQAVGATSIEAILQPLQRASLARQRDERSFDASETRFIEQMLKAARARLDCFDTGRSVDENIVTIEQRIPAFLAASIPGSDGEGRELGLASNVHSLDDVFSSEANELLESLRKIAYASRITRSDIRSALGTLHTLKGSALMAGRVTIADRAHALESELQKSQEIPEQIVSLKDGYQALARFMIATATNPTVSEGTQDADRSPSGSGFDDKRSGSSDSQSNYSAGERPNPDALSEQLTEQLGEQSEELVHNPLVVSDKVFDGWVDLATDMNVNLAKSSNDFMLLEQIQQDIEITAIRWRALLTGENNDEVQTVATSEMLADLEAAADAMRDTLQNIDRQYQQTSRASASLQQGLVSSRLVRLDMLHERLTQVAQNATEGSGKQVRFFIKGGELSVERSLFRKLVTPLEHLIRNAVVHGIEPSVQRQLAGKPMTGKVTLSASTDGTDLVLQLSDDGRGIDKDKINKALVARGQAEVETHQELQDALFESGFSSISSPTALAGHGIGLSVVKSLAGQLDGLVQLATQTQDTTTFVLRFPQRLLVSQVVMVENQGQLFAIPVSQVESVQSATSADDSTETQGVNVAARVLLSDLLMQGGARGTDSNFAKHASVLVRAGGKSWALQVDQIVGYRELATQSLGAQLASLRRYSGGSVLPDGRQVLILDMDKLALFLNDKLLAKAPALPESLCPVALVVDDSLTMRAAAENILSQGGLTVRKRRDGFEALESLAQGLPDLIILDIEMPRLDGPGFLHRALEQYGDACPPVIAVSSRDDAKARAVMNRLGAVYFLVKPYSASQLREAVKTAGLRLPDLTIA